MVRHETATLHLPTSILGSRYIEVDCNIQELVALFWNKGMMTYYSCEGEDILVSARNQQKKDQLAYIMLRWDRVSVKFIEKIVTDYIPKRHGQTFDIEFGTNAQGLRKITIRFPKTTIQQLTDFLLTLDVYKDLYEHRTT